MPGNDGLHSSFMPRFGPRRAARPHAVVLLLAALALAPALARAEATVAAALAARVAELRQAGTPQVQGIALGALPVMADFYAARAFEPAWTDAARTAELLQLIESSVEHGLDPADFLADRLRGLLAGTGRDVAQLAERDLLLTEALVRYGYQRRFGKVDPRKLEPAWNFSRGFANGANPAALLAEALAAPSLATFLEAKIPRGPWYLQLQRSLARYRTLAARGGWQPLPAGPTLRPGERDRRAALLRDRLGVEGDYAPADPVPDAEYFDEGLAAAVVAFQARHALATDGVVGARTLEALNVPVQGRIDQLRLSLERVRWLSGDVPDTYVVVNIAGARVGFVRERRLVWTSRVVVGRTARQTPVFRGLMTYVELNPTWTIPPTILRADVLPILRRDPAYLLRQNITVIDRAGRVVDPLSVDWRTAGVGSYTLRQEPGPANALGRIKLMFPNRHAVYLHDTPATALFERPERTFSSGCIRVEDPLALAEFVLASADWDRAALESAIATGATRRIDLVTPVPVLIVYLTAVADSDGTTRFYRDVYGRDPPLLAALRGPVRIDLPAARGAQTAGAHL